MLCLVRRGDVAIGLVSECESVCCVVVGETETRDGMITPDVHHFSVLCRQTDRVWRKRTTAPHTPPGVVGEVEGVA